MFSQAGPGTLPPLAIGPGGSNRTPIGSVIINALIPGGLIFYMDCQPGATNDVSPVDLAGPSLTPAPAVAFDTLDGPHTTTCLSALGRQVSGAPANLPDGIDRELDPLRISLAASGFAPEFTAGVPYVLPAATLSAELSKDTLATLGRFQDGGAPLVVAGKSYPVDVWVTIAASNTAEGTQTVRAATAYVPSAAFDAIPLTVALPSTSWTPTGAGPVRFTLGQAGPAIQVAGPATGGPGGPIVTQRVRARALRRRRAGARHRAQRRGARLRTGRDPRRRRQRSRGRTPGGPGPRAATRSTRTSTRRCSRPRSK